MYSLSSWQQIKGQAKDWKNKRRGGGGQNIIFLYLASITNTHLPIKRNAIFKPAGGCKKLFFLMDKKQITIDLV